MPRMVWAEFGENGLPIRIVKSAKHAVLRVAYVLRSMAVKSIRHQIWIRDGKKCTHCGADVSWETMEMHERIWRGRGGEISVANGTTLCYDCHQNDPVAGHGKRRVGGSPI